MLNLSDPADRLAWREWIAGLGPRDRRIALMVAEGYTQTEIACDIGVTQQAVSWRIRRLQQGCKICL